MTDTPHKRYLFEYRFKGSEWGIEISAASPEEAKERVNAMMWAQYRGEIFATIKAPGFARVLEKIGNWAWGNAAAQTLAPHPAVAILRSRWLESAKRAQAFATENPETPEQWRAYGAAETQFALADELEDVKNVGSRVSEIGLAMPD